MGVTDLKRIYTAADLASSPSLIFAATGVTDGDLLKGVRFFGDGLRTSSVVMETQPQRIRFIDTIHLHPDRRLQGPLLSSEPLRPLPPRASSGSPASRW